MKSVILLTLVLSLAGGAGYSQQKSATDQGGSTPSKWKLQMLHPRLFSSSSYVIGASDVLNVTVWRKRHYRGRSWFGLMG